MSGIRVSLPEVLAGCSCALFITGSPITGSVFLSLSAVTGMMRYAVEMQEIKAKQEQFERVFQAVNGVVNYVEEFFRGIIFVASQQQQLGSHDDDDDDTSNYN